MLQQRVKPVANYDQAARQHAREEEADCQIEHGAQRSICFRLRESFEDYLRSANASDETMPTTVADLEKAPSCSPYFPCHDISMFGNAGIIERVSKSLRKSGV